MMYQFPDKVGQGPQGLDMQWPVVPARDQEYVPDHFAMEISK